MGGTRGTPGRIVARMAGAGKLRSARAGGKDIARGVATAGGNEPRLSESGGRSGAEVDQALKLWPQPQLPEAFGFEILKPAP